MEMLARRGALAVDADHLVHQLLETDPTVRAEVVARFGTMVYTAEEHIDRTRLGGVVFSDPEALRDLEAILHPRVSAMVSELIGSSDSAVAVIEAIKLLESELRSLCGTIWVTTCSEEQQVLRLIEERGLSRREAVSRVRGQLPQAEKLAQADVVIDTSGRLDETEKQVELAWQRELEKVGA